jgi:hypothetical protein
VLAVAATSSGAAAAPPSPGAPTESPGEIQLRLDKPIEALGIRLMDVPTKARNDPRARLYIIDHLAPGAVIRRHLEITNTTGSAANIALYATGAAISDGAFLGSAGHTANEISTWTSVTPPSAKLRSHGRMTATVTIAVARDAPPGEQLGVVWAEVRSAPVSGGGVIQVNRVGVRLYVSIGKGNAPAADFTIRSFTAARDAAGRPVFVTTVRNTGGRALDMSGNLYLSGGAGGLRAGPFPVQLGTTLAVGATEPVTIALDSQLPNGPWDVRIVLRSGLLERTGTGTLTIPEPGATVTVKATSGRPWWQIPAAVALVVLLVGGLAWSLQRRRRRRHGRMRGSRLSWS